MSSESTLKKVPFWINPAALTGFFLLILEAMRGFFRLIMPLITQSEDFARHFSSTEIAPNVYIANDPFMFITLAIVERTIFMLVPILVARWVLSGPAWKPPVFEFSRVSGRQIAVFTAVGLGVCALANFFTLATGMFFKIFSLYPKPTVLPYDGRGGTLIFNLLASAFLPAVLEELLCRGILVKTLRPLGNGVAILVSAVLFALSHQTLNQIPFSLLLGLYLAFVYVQTDNLLIPMFIHFLNNAFSVIITHLQFVPHADANATMWGCYIAMIVIGLAAIPFIEETLTRSSDPRPKTTLWQRSKPVFLSIPVLLFILISLVGLIGRIDFRPPTAPSGAFFPL